MFLGIGVMASFGCLFLLFPHVLLGVFQPESEVLYLGKQLLFVAAGFQIFDAIAMVAICSLNGAGDTKFVMLVSVGISWLVKLPLGYFWAIVCGWGAVGAWFAVTVEFFLLALIGLWRLRGEKWLTHDTVQKKQMPISTETVGEK